MTDYWFNTTYACGLVTVDRKSIIVDTCLIFKWMIGNNYDYIVNYLISKRQHLGNKVIDIYQTESEKLEDEDYVINEVHSSEYGKIKIKNE